MEHPQNPIIDSHDLVKIVIKDRMHIVIHTDVHTTYIPMYDYIAHDQSLPCASFRYTYYIWYVHYSYVDFTYAQWGHTTYL